MSVREKGSVYEQPSVYNQGGSGGGGGGGGLPLGLMQVEYIKNTYEGVFYCDWDDEFITDSNPILFVDASAEVQEGDSSSDFKYLVMAQYGETSNFLRVSKGQNSSHQLMVSLYSGTPHNLQTTMSLGSGNTFKSLLTTCCGQSICSNNSYVQFAQHYTNSKVKSICIFGFIKKNGTWIHGSSYCSREKIYRIKILDSNFIPRADLLPVRQGTTPAFYDLVNDKLFTPTRGGNYITYGPDVV